MERFLRHAGGGVLAGEEGDLKAVFGEAFGELDRWVDVALSGKYD